MNIHEYQAKAILKSYGVNTPVGYLATSTDEAVCAAKKIFNETQTDVYAVKAQIHAGGRGKGGGVKIAKSLDEVEKYATEIIGMTLITPQTGNKGKLVRKVLIEQGIYYSGENSVQEFYISILLDRKSGHNIIIYSPAGGMNIEEVAIQSKELIFKEEVDPSSGLLHFQAQKIAYNLNLTNESFNNMTKFVEALYKAYINSDTQLLEINPVVKTSDNKIFAADAKVTIDDNAMFRHSDYETMRDFDEEDPVEVEAGKYGFNFIKLDGNVGCMVNGAGLAMATMDLIKLNGGNPANFLDVGGAANAETIEAGFRMILQDPEVKVILINVFGGIVRCDRIAQGVINAYKSFGEIKTPVIVRMQGTNAAEAKQILDNSGLHIHSAVTLQEAANLVREKMSY